MARKVEIQNNQKTLKSITNTKMLKDLIFENAETNIRIGVIIATEEAIRETLNRKIQCPLTVEEKIFLQQNRT